MAMLKVDGVAVPDPSSMTWGLSDISAPDAGRGDDTLMYKGRVGQKRTLDLAWAQKDKSETSKILKAFNPEYIQVTYEDAMSGEEETRTFYVQDRTAPVQYWWVGDHRYSKISFKIAER